MYEDLKIKYCPEDYNYNGLIVWIKNEKGCIESILGIDN